MKYYKVLKTILIVLIIGVMSLSMLGNIMVNANENGKSDVKNKHYN